MENDEESRATSSPISIGKLRSSITNLVRSADENHEKIADHVDSVAKATKVAAGVTLAGAALVAPTGITALAISAGIVSAPVIVTVAPIMAGVAGFALTISAGTSLYAKYKRGKSKEDKKI